MILCYDLRKRSKYKREERYIQVLVGKPKGKRPGVVGRIILRWIFRKLYVGLWTGTSSIRIGTGGGHV
jgi:hypothetical protein